jgi:hypothetical protein
VHVPTAKLQKRHKRFPQLARLEEEGVQRLFRTLFIKNGPTRVNGLKDD